MAYMAPTYGPACHPGGGRSSCGPVDNWAQRPLASHHRPHLQPHLQKPIIPEALLCGSIVHASRWSPATSSPSPQGRTATDHNSRKRSAPVKEGRWGNEERAMKFLLPQPPGRKCWACPTTFTCKT
mmetsp:Transcript_131914/g.228604  ORF Transcript_131914/g.228604 Transcript_131914/m.228604 type:complete len:126 (+) Transcript_131914:529-906(+)